MYAVMSPAGVPRVSLSGRWKLRLRRFGRRGSRSLRAPRSRPRVGCVASLGTALPPTPPLYGHEEQRGGGGRQPKAGRASGRPRPETAAAEALGVGRGGREGLTRPLCILTTRGRGVSFGGIFAGRASAPPSLRVSAPPSSVVPSASLRSSVIR